MGNEKQHNICCRVIGSCICQTDKFVAEREAVERERRAYTEGALSFARQTSTEAIVAQARCRFPLPTVRQLRLWSPGLGRHTHRFNPDNDCWELRALGGGEWIRWWCTTSDADPICHLADLRQNPYEEVES